MIERLKNSDLYSYVSLTMVSYCYKWIQMVLADLEKTTRETLSMSSLDRDGYGADRYTVYFVQTEIYPGS